MILRYCLHHPDHHHHRHHVITPPDKYNKVRGRWKIYERHFRLRCRHVPDAALAVRVAYLVIIIMLMMRMVMMTMTMIVRMMIISVNLKKVGEAVAERSCLNPQAVSKPSDQHAQYDQHDSFQNDQHHPYQ